MIEIQDYIRKLYEQTGVKLKEDDPILIELVAQQIILEEFLNDLNIHLDNLENKYTDAIKNIIVKNNKTISNLSKNIIIKLEQQKSLNNKKICLIKKKYNRITYMSILINFMVLLTNITIFLIILR